MTQVFLPARALDPADRDYLVYLINEGNIELALRELIAMLTREPA